MKGSRLEGELCLSSMRRNGHEDEDLGLEVEREILISALYGGSDLLQTVRSPVVVPRFTTQVLVLSQSEEYFRTLSFHLHLVQ
ncbi:hypothetical protein RRG08_031746 [Elysia crispata]|uniref:Uncharacterized protein n=1 Tax=Elysia crispata TaxID=231223 RepID=A0AAE0ZF77_9GAST|nr:hypothetical protein RRG08_031746 [Elysia crispata]